MREPTYEELAEKRREAWHRAQARAAADLLAFQARVRQMADTVIRPDPSVPWTPGGVVCPVDGNTAFYVIRYTSVNGQRYRTELKCTNNDFQGTYDWIDRVFL